MEIPRDTQLTGDGGEVEIVRKARLARNASELDALLTLFCRSHVGNYAKYDSTPVLRSALLEMLEHYFWIFETEAPKVILAATNRSFMEELIRCALLRYGNAQKTKPKAPKDYTVSRFEIPATRIYNSAVVRSTEGALFNHALRPYFEQSSASQVERDFARWIDKQTECVDWWYKNGDEGKQHFAIPYTDSGNRQRCFYVDFIVRLKDGMICLFDTKTPGSDEDAPEKNNALWQYIEEHNAKGKRMTGGVLMKKGDNWYYPSGIIDNTDNLDGWSRLDLATL